MQHKESVLDMFGPSGPPKGIADLLSYIKSFCLDHGITTRFEKSDFVDSGDGVQCSGYYESSERELAVAVGKHVSKWLPILLHEFSHSKQYIENPKWFDRGSTSESYTFEWAFGKRSMSRKTMLKHLKICIELERDCEERTIDLIKKFKVGSVISPTDYARKANAYLYFWRYFADTKTWYEKGNPPYDQKDLYEKMPAELQKDFMRMPKAIREAFNINMKKRAVAHTE